MTPRKVLLAFVVVLAGATHLSASGFLGVYGIVEKVVFEPNEQSPERIQVWGAFAYVNGTGGQSLTVTSARRGYMYFRLPGVGEGGSAQSARLLRTEWADLKSVAGTGQAVGFGRWSYFGGFGSLQPDATGENLPYIMERAPGNPRADMRVRPASEPPAAPALYQTDSGVVKLSETGSHAAVVKQLKAALR